MASVCSNNEPLFKEVVERLGLALTASPDWDYVSFGSLFELPGLWRFWL